MGIGQAVRHWVLVPGSGVRIPHPQPCNNYFICQIEAVKGLFLFAELIKIISYHMYPCILTVCG
jgi:hypothetical protein